MIWLGSIFYLTDVLKTKINYASSASSFSEVEMEKQIGKAPILLHGGGNLGDLWLKHQQFREEIISRYKDRPIIILPQSIYFANQENLVKAERIFNSHPNLTLFARDIYSYELALKHFNNCRVLKSPDMAFQMIGIPTLFLDSQKKNSILYHCRTDQELNQASSPISINLPNVVVQDWVPRQQKKVPVDNWLLFKQAGEFGSWSALNNRAKIIKDVLRKSKQQGLAVPIEYTLHYLWQRFHPYAANLDKIYNPSMHRKSWGFMHSGICQLNRHRLVITNRLHGHVLCTLFNIPHVFLSNSYHKNESFYKTWTYKLPFCRFAKNASQIEMVAQELLQVYSN